MLTGVDVIAEADDISRFKNYNTVDTTASVHDLSLTTLSAVL